MAVSKKIQRFDQYLLRGNLRAEGFERWRYVFNGVSKETGQNRIFFIEMYLVNPALSPDSAVIAQKTRVSEINDDIQYALAGTPSALNFASDVVVKPSYILVKAGTLGRNGKQLNCFLPSSELSWNREVGALKASNFEFSTDVISGAIEVTEQNLQSNPELVCNSGLISWNLHMQKCIVSKPFVHKKNETWFLSGLKAEFIGSINCDGDEYTVTTKESFGFHDKMWGAAFSKQFFHLSASRLADIISGKVLLNSAFAVEENSDGKIMFELNLENEIYRFDNSSFFKKCREEHDCNQGPSENQHEKLHWSLSVNKGRIIIDVDVYCNADELFVRDYEIPQGNRTILKVLGGGTGHGEIKIFKKVKQNLEMIHHIGIYDCVCEFGKPETIGE